MKFAQIIEFKTSRIDDFNANLDAWRLYEFERGVSRSCC